MRRPAAAQRVCVAVVIKADSRALIADSGPPANHRRLGK